MSSIQNWNNYVSLTYVLTREVFFLLSLWFLNKCQCRLFIYHNFYFKTTAIDQPRKYSNASERNIESKIWNTVSFNIPLFFQRIVFHFSAIQIWWHAWCWFRLAGSHMVHEVFYDSEHMFLVAICKTYFFPKIIESNIDICCV